MNVPGGRRQLSHEFKNAVAHVTVFGQMAGGGIGFLDKLIQRSTLAEIRVRIFTELAGLGCSAVTDNFAMKMIHGGFPR